MGDIIIRRIQSYDDILKAIIQCVDSIYDQSYNNEKIIVELSKKYSQKAFFYIIEIGKDIAGFIAFYGNDKVKKTGFVSMIVVKQGYQGCGIGNILDTATVICKQQGMSSIELEVNATNVNAIRFYERKGFCTHKMNAGNAVLSKIIG